MRAPDAATAASIIFIPLLLGPWIRRISTLVELCLCGGCVGSRARLSPSGIECANRSLEKTMKLLHAGGKVARGSIFLFD
jgi:hypothetical protein